MRALGRPRDWKQGSSPFLAGTEQVEFFKITKGFVAQVRNLDDGRRQVVGIAGPGDCVGYLAKEGRYSFEGVALSDVEACSFNRRGFEDMCAQHPPLSAAVADTLSAVLRKTAHLLSAVGKLDATERLAFLIMDLKTRLARSPAGGSTDIQQLRLEEVSDLLGMRAETASRALRALVDLRVIEISRRHGWRVIDEERLAQIAKWGDLGPGRA